MKLTEWYSGDQKPVRVGVYERNFEDGLTIAEYSYWDGKNWKVSGLSVPDANMYKIGAISAKQRLKWRGIAK